MPNVPIDAPKEAVFDLKFHQIAIYHHDPEMAMEEWCEMGFNNWTGDRAELVGTEWSMPSSKVGTMWFNYDIAPLELEYVKYNREYRHSADDRDGHPPFLSHMSTYCEDVYSVAYRLWSQYRLVPYHRFVTKNHLNPYVLEKGIRFMEAIYDTRNLLGYDVKLIQRVGAGITDQEVDHWANVDISTLLDEKPQA